MWLHTTTIKMANGINLKMLVNFFFMLFKRSLIHIKFFFIIFFFLTTYLNAGIDNCDRFGQAVEDKKNFNYPTKTINDLGIFFQKKFTYNGVEKIIRDIKNYPIIYFSLFEKDKLKNGTVIKSINNNNLSKISDEELILLIQKNNYGSIEYFKTSGNTDIVKVYGKDYDGISFFVDELFINTIGEVDAKKGFFKVNYDYKLVYDRPDLKSEGVLLKNDECTIKTKSYETKFSDIYRPDKEILIKQFDKDRDKIEDTFGFYNEKGNTYLFQSIKGTSKIRAKFNFSKFPFDTQPLQIQIISYLKINEENETTQIFPTLSLFKNIKNLFLHQLPLLYL